jgi:hypothetical protein
MGGLLLFLQVQGFHPIIHILFLYPQLPIIFCCVCDVFKAPLSYGLPSILLGTLLRS